LYYNTLSAGLGGTDTVLGSVSQALNASMTQGHAYTISFSLVNFDADANNAGHDYFEIWLGYYLCDVNPVNAVSVFPVTSIPGTWTNYSFTYYASQPFTFITLRSNSTAQQRAFWIGVDCFGVCDSSSATGLSEIAASGIAVYPNPATNTITVNPGNNNQFSLRIFDLTGRELISKESAGSITIDVSQLSKGAYLAKVIQGDKSYCQKLVIQ
jgi:hypothetical protein